MKNICANKVGCMRGLRVCSDELHNKDVTDA